MALALWSVTIVVAPILGPILGGYISDNYHWDGSSLLTYLFGEVLIIMHLKYIGRSRNQNGN